MQEFAIDRNRRQFEIRCDRFLLFDLWACLVCLLIPINCVMM